MTGKTSGDVAVNTLDLVAVKRVLDEKACEVLLEKGYEENLFVSNFKIALGLLACVFPLVAQFYPLKFPHNVTLLITCICCYFVCTVALQLFCFYMERDIIMPTGPKKGSLSSSGLNVSSSLPRFQDMYSITIASADPRLPKSVTLHRSIAEWFDTTGAFAKNAFAEEIANLLQTFENSAAKKLQ
eukprot:jgi/Mesvir1/16096/Mv08390-RA.1